MYFDFGSSLLELSVHAITSKSHCIHVDGISNKHTKCMNVIFHLCGFLNDKAGCKYFKNAYHKKYTSMVSLLCVSSRAVDDLVQVLSIRG